MTEELTADFQKTRLEVFNIMDRHLDAAYEDLDRLTDRAGVPAEVIVKALREGGYDDDADGYEDWIAEGESNNSLEA